MTTHRSPFRMGRLAKLLAAVALGACFSEGVAAASEPSPADIARRGRALAVPFVENQGQVDGRVGFYARTFGGTVFVTRAGEIVYALPAARAGDGTAPRALALREVLVGRKAGAVRGEGQAVTRVSEFRGGDRAGWRSALPTYDAVSLGEVYHGIDLRLKARGDNVEKIFRVKPGARPGAIRLRLEGTGGLRVNERGELTAATALGPVSFTKPAAFQEIEGRRVDVAVRYALHGDRTYGFAVGDYDGAHPLVIDPLLASTFIGARGLDRAHAITLAPPPQGPPVGYHQVFIAGATFGSHFPTAPAGRAYDTHLNGDEDAIVAKLDRDLTTLLAATYLGGGGVEEAWGVSVEAGNVYVTGFTNSADFPTTLGAARRVYGGGLTDAFVAKFDNGLETLLASTYLGGALEDRGQALAAVTDFGVYVTGYTASRDFPREYQRGHGGQLDAFVTRLHLDLSAVDHSVVLGGVANDRGYAIAVGGFDPGFLGGDPVVVITGCAGRPSGQPTPDAFYPVTPLAYDVTQSNDLEDAFVTVLSSELSNMFGSTFFGGADGGASFQGTCGYAAAIDRYNSIFVAGKTFSDIPTTVGAYDATSNDAVRKGMGVCRRSFDRRQPEAARGDAFVAKFSGYALSLDSLTASTYLGGCAADTARALALDASGNVFVGGYTYSPDFPTTVGAYDTTHGGKADGFVSKLDGGLSSLLASTFLGGGKFDAAIGLAIDTFGPDSPGTAYVAGYTYSDDFPTTPGAYSTILGGSSDAFVSKLDGNLDALVDR